MTTVLKADIFFFISSISVVVVVAAVVVGVYYAIRLMREARELVKSIRAEVDVFSVRRRNIELRIRTFEKWLSILGRDFFGTSRHSRSTKRDDTE